MWIVALCACLGLMLLLLEAFFANFLFATSGGLLLLSSLIALTLLDPPVQTMGYYLVLLSLSLMVLWRVGRYIRKSRQPRLPARDAAIPYAPELKGKRAVTLTDLSPLGEVLFDGRPAAAIARSGVIAKGSPVLIVGGERGILWVEPHP